MSCARAVVALMGCVFLGLSGPLHAQARGAGLREIHSNEKEVEKQLPVREELSRAKKMEAMEGWLKRLVGLYRVDEKRTVRNAYGQEITEELTGNAKCNLVGEGAGVRCIIRLIRLPPVVPPLSKLSPHLSSVTWPDLFESQPILYFGINPDLLEIQSTVVSVRWVAARSGRLTEEAVNFATDNWKDCQVLLSGCWIVTRIESGPAADIVMQVSANSTAAPRTRTGHTSDMEIRLHREPPAQTEEASMLVSEQADFGPWRLGMPKEQAVSFLDHGSFKDSAPNDMEAASATVASHKGKATLTFGKAGLASIRLHKYEGKDWREARSSILEVFDEFRVEFGGVNVKGIANDIGRDELDLILQQSLGAAEEANKRYGPKGQYMVLIFDMVPRRQPVGERLHCQWVYDGRSNTYSLVLYRDRPDASTRYAAANLLINKL